MTADEMVVTTRRRHSVTDGWVILVDDGLYRAALAGQTAGPEPTGEDTSGTPPGGDQFVVSPEPGSLPPPEVAAAVDSLEDEPATTERVLGRMRVRRVNVPTTWEAEGWPKTLEGPVWFATRLPREVDYTAGAVVVRFGAVSFSSTVWVDGAKVGEHLGMWDEFDVPFRLDHQPANGRGPVLAVEVYKPWSRYPVRESLAGFIPYVTTTFGGIWRGVSLAVGGGPCIDDVWVRVVDGRLFASVAVSEMRPPAIDAERPTRESTAAERTRYDLSVSVGEGDQCARITTPLVFGDLQGERRIDVDVSGLPIPRWSPEQPRTETVRFDLIARNGGGSAAVVDRRELAAGRRTVERVGKDVEINGRPTYLRGVLHWMAYPQRFSPSPNRETIVAEFDKIRSLGFNLVKLCLVVPDDLYFQVADEMGMLLWIELPMWLPKVTDRFRRRVPEEYRAILRRVRNHPSVVVYTLGCELSRDADAEFLGGLYRLVKEETASPLVRDNSGGAEAYGGAEVEFADFADFHFYAEANQFTDLVDYFVPPGRPPRPLLFGEYADSDTLRSVASVAKRLGGEPYWMHPHPVENPKGVRWDYHVTTHLERLATLRTAGICEPEAELTRRSYERSCEYRKAIIERTRLHPAPTGYVVTNIQDTPVTTSGVLDDFGEAKFPPEVFGRFNADTVVVVSRDRRRTWRSGGDRRQFLDEHVVSAGESVALTVSVSHYGAEPIDRPRVCAALYDEDTGERVSRSWEFSVGRPLPVGFVGEVGRWIARFDVLGPGDRAGAGGDGFDEADPSDRAGAEDGDSSGVGDSVAAYGSAPARVRAVSLRVTVSDGDVPTVENRFGWWVLPTPVGTTGSPRVRRQGPDMRMVVFDPIGELRAAIASLPRSERAPFGEVVFVDRADDARRAAVEYPGALGQPSGVAPPSEGRGARTTDTGRPTILVSTILDDSMIDAYRSGAAVLFLLGPAADSAIEEVPFYREGIPLIHDEAARTVLGQLPHRGFAGEAFSGVVPDRALVVDAFAKRVGGDLVPVISRLDARQLLVHRYLCVSGDEFGGRFAATTLRLCGGLGRTPSGFRHNVFGRYLLLQIVDYLTATRPAD